MSNHLSESFIKKVVNIVKKNTQPALGCTEPVAVAFTSSVASKYFKWELENLEIEVSKNIFKNGKSVIVPGTKGAGLDLAGALGFIGGDSDKGFMVLEDTNKDDLDKAMDFIEKNIVKLTIASDTPDVYVKCIAKGQEHKVVVTTANGHISLNSIIVDDDVIFEEDEEENELDLIDELKTLSLSQIREIVEKVEIEDIRFIKNGIDQNLMAAREGLLNNYGLNVGSTIRYLVDSGKLKLDIARKSRMMTAAAADMRMGGGSCEIITSGGSGNQGIGVLVTIAIVGEEFDIDEQRIIRAAFFGNLMNSYVKLYSGKLSGMCGCAIGAGIGASVGVTWMLGGKDEEIAGACNNMFANTTGMICDGAKDTCSLKLATSAEESVIAALLALNGCVVRPKIGIVGKNVEETIKNIGKLSRKGFSEVDETILEIIENN